MTNVFIFKTEDPKYSFARVLNFHDAGYLTNWQLHPLKYLDNCPCPASSRARVVYRD